MRVRRIERLTGNSPGAVQRANIDKKAVPMSRTVFLQVHDLIVVSP